MAMLRFGISILVALLVSAFAPNAPYVSVPDPYILTDPTNQIGWNDTQGLTPKSVQYPTIDPVNDVVIILAGEGNIGAPNTEKYVGPANPSRIFNLNIYDGAIYLGTDPWLGPSSFCGATGGGYQGCQDAAIAGQLADAIIADGLVSNVYIIPIAIYGSTVADWDTGALSNRIGVAIKRLAAYQSIPSLTIYLLWGQGESDHGTSQVDYTTHFTNLVATARAALPVGWTMPVFIARQTWVDSVTDANVRAAQSAIPDNDPGGLNIWTGPDADTLDNTWRTATGNGQDNTYWTGQGFPLSDPYGISKYVDLWMTQLRLYGGLF